MSDERVIREELCREAMRLAPFYAAARGERELRAGRGDVARVHFEAALGLARGEAERSFLRRRIAACTN